jgi:hypothetical protein
MMRQSSSSTDGVLRCKQIHNKLVLGGEQPYFDNLVARQTVDAHIERAERAPIQPSKINPCD